VTKTKPWTRLDQALRATDLLLQAGGFAAIVLDLGDMEAEHAMRIPLATWFRFRQAADRTRCSLVVLGKTAYAQSGAEAVLESMPFQPEIVGGTVWRGCAFGSGANGNALCNSLGYASRLLQHGVQTPRGKRGEAHERRTLCLRSCRGISRAGSAASAYGYAIATRSRARWPSVAETICSLNRHAVQRARCWA